jgi:hypothetical protein
MKETKLNRYRALTRLVGVAASVAAFSSSVGYAGSLTYDFSTDPSQGADPIIVGGNNDAYYVSSGGNPGGFLAITYPIGSQKTQVVFPDTDPGKVVTAFEFSCDLRVGNPQTERAADGFSISFARDGDPILEDPVGSDMFGGNCCAETGTQTGIAVSFDTWSGNTFPADPKDTTDIEGIIIRVDNVTVKKISLPTRNGLADDPTTLQTGPRDADYWANSGDPKEPASWAGLAWKPFSISLKEDGKLTVKYKGNTLLDNFQTAYFPTAGRLVMAGRTGGANEHTHVDNIKLTTTAASCASVPTVPGNLKVVEAGARRALVSWDASNMAGQTTGIAYEVEVNGKAIPGQVLATQYEISQLAPGGANTFKVRAKNVCAQASAFATLAVPTVAEVDSPGVLLAQVYRTATDGTAFGGAGQDGIDTVIGDAKYPNSPDDVYYVNGFQFGEPSFGNTYGENHMVRIAGTFTAPKSGNFRFFVRSDDASRLYVKQGTAIPNPSSDTAIAQENGCCGGYEEPGAGDNGDGTFPTSEPIALTAGTTYGVLFLVKEGGGGDWGQVGWREEGTKPIFTLVGSVINGGKGDPVGATATITTPPSGASVAGYKAASFSVTGATTSPYGKGPFYQWFKNGTPIIGANGPTLDIPVVQPADNNAKIKVAVSTIGKSVESPEVTLTVTPDVAPAVASVTGSDTFNQATVKFDQPVTPATADKAANYTFDNGLTVSGATIVDPFTVRLNTGTQTAAKVYNLTVNGVQNLGGKAASNATGTLTAWDLVAGAIRADQFLNFNGASLADMDAVISDPKYPDSPDVVRFLSNGLTFGEPNFGDTYGENHMVAVKGVLKPTETASYRFFIRSDDASRLFINTSGAALPDAKTATAIATEAGCCGSFENPGSGDNGDGTFPTSEPVSLTAGQSYGVLFLVKEGGGGDWGQVAWRKEGDTTPASSLQPIKSAIYWYAAPSTGGSTPTISIAGGAGAKITFTGSLQSRDALGAGSWTDVAGATSPYTVPGGTTIKFYRSKN